MRKYHYLLSLFVTFLLFFGIAKSTDCYATIIVTFPREINVSNVYITYTNEIDVAYTFASQRMNLILYPYSTSEFEWAGKKYISYIFKIRENANFCGYVGGGVHYIARGMDEEGVAPFLIPLGKIDAIYDIIFVPLPQVVDTEFGKDLPYVIFFPPSDRNMNYGQTYTIQLFINSKSKIADAKLHAYERNYMISCGYLDGDFSFYDLNLNPFAFPGSLGRGYYERIRNLMKVANISGCVALPITASIEVPETNLYVSSVQDYTYGKLITYNYTPLTSRYTQVDFYLEIKYATGLTDWLFGLKTYEYPVASFVLNRRINENYLLLPVQYDIQSNEYMPRISFSVSDASYEKIRDSLRISFILNSFSSWYPDSINVTAIIKTENGITTRELTLPLFWDGKGYYYKFPDEIIKSLVGKPFKITIKNLKTTLIDYNNGYTFVNFVNSNNILEVISYETFPLYIANSKLDARINLNENTFYYNLEFDVFRNDTGEYVNNSICRIYRFYVGETPNDLRLIREYPNGIGPIPFDKSKNKYYISSSYTFQEGQVTNNDRYFAIDVKCVLPDEFIYGEGETRIYSFFVFPINIFGFDITTVEGMMSFFYFSVAFLISFLVGLFVRSPVFSFLTFIGIMSVFHFVGYLPVQHFLLILMLSSITFVMLVMLRVIRI